MNKEQLIKELIDIKRRERKLQERDKQRMKNEEIYEKQKNKDKENFEIFYDSLKDHIQFNNSKIEIDLAFMEMNHYFKECKIMETPIYLGVFLTFDLEFYYIFKILDPVDNQPIRCIYIRDEFNGNKFMNMNIWKEKQKQKAWNKVKEKYGSYECYDKETGEQWQLMGDDETGSKFIFRHRRLNGKREYFEVDKKSLDNEIDKKLLEENNINQVNELSLEQRKFELINKIQKLTTKSDISELECCLENLYEDSKIISF